MHANISHKSLWPFLENMEMPLCPIVGRFQPAVVIGQWCSGERGDHAHTNPIWSRECGTQGPPLIIPRASTGSWSLVPHIQAKHTTKWLLHQLTDRIIGTFKTYYTDGIFHNTDARMKKNFVSVNAGNHKASWAGISLQTMVRVLQLSIRVSNSSSVFRLQFPWRGQNAQWTEVHPDGLHVRTVWGMKWCLL
jgi:hypothetical protein